MKPLDTSNESEPSAPNESKFIGTDNPRHLRALAVMLRRPISRQELDSVAGCANGPALVSDLRDRGLTIPCERIHFTDRDGEPCHPGVYSLTGSDRRKVHQWQAKCHQSGRAS